MKSVIFLQIYQRALHNRKRIVQLCCRVSEKNVDFFTVEYYFMYKLTSVQLFYQMIRRLQWKEDNF